MNSIQSPMGLLLNNILHNYDKKDLIKYKEDFDNDFIPIISTLVIDDADKGTPFDYEVNHLVMDVFRSVDKLYQYVLTDKKEV